MTVETADDLAAFFSQEDFAVAGSYSVDGGDAVDVSLLFDRPIRSNELGTVGLRGGAYVAQVRKSEIAAPADGAMLTVDGMTFVLRGADLDPSGAIWTLDLDLQA